MDCLSHCGTAITRSDEEIGKGSDVCRRRTDVRANEKIVDENVHRAGFAQNSHVTLASVERVDAIENGRVDKIGMRIKRGISCGSSNRYMPILTNGEMTFSLRDSRKAAPDAHS